MGDQKEIKKPIFHLTGKEIIVFLLVGIVLMLLPILFIESDISWISFKDTGTIGDTIGGITAPFIGFGGSILVYLALKAQIDANNAIQIEFEKQQKKDYRQNFETTFFNMLTIHHDIVKNIDFNVKKIYENDQPLQVYILLKERVRNSNHDLYDRNQQFISRDVFKFSLEVLYDCLQDDLIFNNHINDFYYTGNRTNIKQNVQTTFLNANFFTDRVLLNRVSKDTAFQSIYDAIYFKLNTDFGHYFRNLYRIIKLIDEKEFDKDILEDYKIKYSYTSIVRAQLSDDEILWLFFNCISNKGSSKFKPLLEKYTFLKIIDKRNPVYGYYKDLYLPSAFKKPNDIEEHIKKFGNINF